MRKSIYLQIMGDTPMNRILDFLVNFQDFDYNLTDIAKFSQVSYSTLMQNWSNLEENQIVICTRTVGKSKMYKLNTKSPFIKKFSEFYWAVVNEHLPIEKKTEKEIEATH